MTIVVPVCAAVLSALALVLALVSYYKQRVRSTIDYWVSTAEARYEARGILPFEFDRAEVAAFCSSVQTLDADLSASHRDVATLRRQYADNADAMSDSDRALASRLAQRTLLYRYLGVIETLGAGVNAKAFSVNTVRLLDGKRLREVWLAYEPLVAAWRQGAGGSDVYTGVQQLAHKLRSKH